MDYFINDTEIVNKNKIIIALPHITNQNKFQNKLCSYIKK